MFNLIYGSKPSRFYCWHWTSHRQQLQLGMSWRQLTIRSRRVHWLGRDQPKGKSQKRNRILDLHFLMASNMSPRGRWSSRWVCSFSLKRSSATFRPYEIQQRIWQNLICSSAKAQMRIQQSMIASSLKTIFWGKNSLFVFESVPAQQKGFWLLTVHMYIEGMW